jgi:hypothetical protein
MLINELCYCKQILLWTTVLTNFFDDIWLCNINITPRLN